MTTYTPCIECEREITLRRAKKTGGYCLDCKQRIKDEEEYAKKDLEIETHPDINSHSALVYILSDFPTGSNLSDLELA